MWSSTAGRGPLHLRDSGLPPTLSRMATEWSETIAISELTDEPAFSEEVTGLIQRIQAAPGTPPHIVLNLSAVTYVNSSNVAQLLQLRSELARHGRRLKLCCLADQVWSVMHISGLDKVFQFAPDTLTALAGLQLEDSEGGAS
jgi:anti-anti-sigma factor